MGEGQGEATAWVPDGRGGLGVRQGCGRTQTASFWLLPPSAQTLLLSSPSSSPPFPVSLFCSRPEGKRGLDAKWRQLFPRPRGGGAAITQLTTWGCRSVWLAEPRCFCSAPGASE